MMSKKNGFVRQIRKDTAAWLMILPFLVLLVYVSWEPMLRGVIWSFCDMKGYTPQGFAGLKNYKIVLGNTSFITTLCNTLKYVFWSLVIGYWIPVVLAVLLNELNRAKGFFRFALYLPAMVPSIAASMLWFYIYYPNESGLLNMAFGYFGLEPVKWLEGSSRVIPMIIISDAWKGAGATMLIYLAALQGCNRELYEAALVDGAGFLKRLWYITLPQISGIMLINLVRQIISVFQIMQQPLAMTDGGPNNASMSLGLLGYRYAFRNFQIGNSLALNVVMFLMLLVLTVFYFFVQKKAGQDE